MNSNKFFDSYYEHINTKVCSVNQDFLFNAAVKIKEVGQKSGKVIVVGNGGSAAIASHVSVDLTKAANIQSINFNESSLLTCFANDYGYENWVKEALRFYAKSNDIVILISSSGQSANIVNGEKQALKMGLPLITLSGFSANNPLKKIGDINLWVNSSHYNTVETTHQIWLLSIVDYLIENPHA